MRVDKSDFYMHCRLHSLQVAVYFHCMGGEGLSDTGGRIFGCSDYSYALPMPLNLARTVCVPITL